MKIDQKLHELLCAYALGEADAGQRIEVERALASSPELRKVLEQIEETIGLVRDSMHAGETMSRGAEEALLSAVSPEPKRSSWHASGWMRMAAGFLVFGGSAMLLRTLYESNTAHMAPEQVAKLRDEETRKAESRLQGLGYVGDDKNAVARLEELVAKREEMERSISTPKVQTDNGTPLPAAQATSPYPNNQGLATDPNGFYTWRDTAALRSAAGAVTARDGAVGESADANDLRPQEMLQEREAPKLRLREQLVPSPAQGRVAQRAGKDAYKGPGDSVTAGGGGSSGPSTPAPGAASLGAAAAMAPSAPRATGSRGELRLAHGGKKADAGDSNSLPEGKAKADELAKKGAEQSSNQLGPGDPFGSPANSAGVSEQQTPAPVDEVQLRLRQLLERADSAGEERLARLKGNGQYKESQRLQRLGYTSGPDGDDELALRQLYYSLAPEQRAQLLDGECRRVFDGCHRLPNEHPRDMFFRYWGDNPFEITVLDALSTFSADVDTASYALARRYLVEGQLPEKAQVRTEEFVNYFKADVPAPTHGTFAIHTDLAPSRFAQPANSLWTLRVVVRGKELAKEERKPLRLTCVIDCSGSMREQNRIETVKDTLRLLLSQLNAADMVGVVAFSTEARQILPLTSVANRGLIEAAIAQLQPDGWTNSEAGLKLGYETALSGLDANATNRVVFLSDGVANQGETDPLKLSESLKPIREKGVYLNTIGVGMNNHNDTLLEQLADKGDGMCSYVDDMREAKRVMMDNFMGSVETIARDVKIQVEFDPAQVARYRLLGYENRAIADADFRNDKVDAGEVGSGHQVTALYEIERNLAVGAEKPLATVRLRWKAPRIVNGPANEEATEVAQEVRGAQQTSFEGADVGYRRAVIVGQFAEFLRRSVNARGRSIDDLLAEAHKLEAQLPQDADFQEFVALAERAKQLVLANLPQCDELCQAIDAYRTWQIQCAQAERLSHERQQQIVEELARQNREMEEKIRELLRRRLENTPR